MHTMLMEPLMMCATRVSVCKLALTIDQYLPLEIETSLAQVGRLQMPSGNSWREWSFLTLSKRKMCRDSFPRVQSGYRWAGHVVATFRLEPQDNESLEPIRCERLSGTSHQACLGDGFGRRLRRPVCPIASFAAVLGQFVVANLRSL